jgi:hypothetical protein
MDGTAMMAEEVKKSETPQSAPTANPRWNPEPLKEAMKIFKGLPKTPEIDQSPNRGTSWMSRK